MLLPKGWAVTIWDLNQTRILGQTEECIGGRPHYFCSESCKEIGCDPTYGSLVDGEQPCTAWASSFEVSLEVAAQIEGAAVKRERADVDALLAKRLDDCFCADDDSSPSPCDACMEVARIRGALAGRNES